MMCACVDFFPLLFFLASYYDVVCFVFAFALRMSDSYSSIRYED